MHETKPDFEEHFLESFQEDRTLTIFQWLNMHFNPLSKHLYADRTHRHQPEPQKTITPFVNILIKIQFECFEFLINTNNGSRARGNYKYLFAEDFLIPPKQ